jgi:hypothetical protein
MAMWRRKQDQPAPAPPAAGATPSATTGAAPPDTPGAGDPGGHPGKRALREVAQLRERVDELEAALTECMRLNKRLAEVTDVVAEVLLPEGERDEERLRRLLEDYDRGL